MRSFPLIFLALLVGSFTSPLNASAATFTILHTNDWQSRLLGFGPNSEYSPDVMNNDSTIGGVARLATLINTKRSAASQQGAVLTLDGGDILMGTLFHTVVRETGTEFQLLKMLGYDAATLGNHDFDYRPDGLGQAIRSAIQGKGVPPLLAANMLFDKAHPGDNELEKLYQEGIIKPSMIIEKNGIRFGLIGIMGQRAIDVCGEIAPITFSNPLETLKQQVHALKPQVDVIIVLSHSGVKQMDGKWIGEDIDYARAIPEIDIIVGGHAHITIPETLVINNTIILQAGSEAQFLGELRMEYTDGKLKMLDYQLHPVDDQTMGDPEVQRFIDAAKRIVSDKVTRQMNYQFDQVIAETSQNLGKGLDEFTLSNIAADSLRKAANVDITITTSGEIRDRIYKGDSGIQQVSDIFRVFPIGIGHKDNSVGYDMVKVYFNGRDLKSILEILLFAYKSKGTAFYPRFSGLRYTYNPYRLPLDQVVSIEVDNDADGYQEINLADNRLYSTTMTHYAFGFLGIINELSHGLLDAPPKLADGLPVPDIESILIDIDPAMPGLQKLKAWRAFIQHISNMPDTDGDGVANITTEGLISEPRVIEARSLNPLQLYKNATYIMWTATGLAFLLLIIVYGLIKTLRSKLKS